MKRNVLLITLLLFAFGMTSMAQSLNSNQQNLREGIFAFLKKEGFSPKKVTDDKLSFKREGHDYYVAIDAQKLSPMKVSISTTKALPDGYAENTVLRAAAANTNSVKYTYLKGVNRVTLSCGIYLKNVEAFNDVFYAWLGDFDDAAMSLNPSVQDGTVVTTESPATPADFNSTNANLVITKLDLANTHKDNTIIDLYGEDLFSDKVMYIKPRVNYLGKVNGEIILRVKWFDTNGKLIRANENVKAGFSQEETFNIGTNERSNTLFLKCFGYDKPGRWKAGKYRVEVWEGNTCLISKEFIIKSRNMQTVADDDKLTNIANTIASNYNELPARFPVYEGKDEPYFTLNQVKAVKGTGINLIFRTTTPLNTLSIDDRSAYIDACEEVFNKIVDQSIGQTNPKNMPTQLDPNEMYFYCLEDSNGAFISGMKF